ncbi:hypothetical protein SDC9_133834 [bioreactor metagenome]|uniref:Uncharacterized protein n=1 Tax=bioreactor metagenome TaxID=1076179 RepID=A0A645DCW0_9ZZZZ
MAETKLVDSDQARCEHGVKNGLRNKFVVLAKQPQIVISSVHDELMLTQSFQKRLERKALQGINQPVRGGGADLDQADFLRIGMQAVRFGIDRDPGCTLEGLHRLLEFIRAINHRDTIQSEKGKGLFRNCGGEAM